MRVLRRMLAVSLAVTEGILLLEGRWQEAIPLHLCSVSAIVALALAWSAKNWTLDFLWYLGMPGALLALLFPAPAVSRYQALLDISYLATHALILAIPAYALRTGQRVRRGRIRHMLLAVHAMALVAFAVNSILGTDFMFLMAPPYGTPLCVPYRMGYGWYILSLECLVLVMLGMTGRLSPALWPKLFL